MSTPENLDALTIDVSADDYARVAATDQEVPSVDERAARTHQSEADFQAEKATYTAKIDNGDIWKSLTNLNPPFPPTTTTTTTTTTTVSKIRDAGASESEEATSKRKLDKKEWLLISSAVGELYWAGDYQKVVDVCDWCDKSFEQEKRMAESVKRWKEKSQLRLKNGTGNKG